jgi:hypothetical protein
VTQKLAMEIGGQFAGWVLSFEGGDPVATIGLRDALERRELSA